MTPTPTESTSLTLPRVAVVGCGAAAREFCLPRLARHKGHRGAVVVVDKHLPQAKKVAEEFGIQHYCSDYLQLPLKTPHNWLSSPITPLDLESIAGALQGSIGKNSKTQGFK